MELKNAILDNVDAVPSLSAKVVTNGRLNAYKALLSVSRPATPANLSATEMSDSRIDLSWNDNAATETGFAIERKTGAGGTYSQIATTGQNITSYSDTGLSASPNYYYRVRAYISSVDSDYSNQANATAFTPPPPAPDAPSGLSAAAVSASQVDLSWTDKEPSNSASNEDGFRIERKTGTGGTYSQIATAGQDIASFTDNGLTPSTTYYYRVLAYNTGGDSAYSNEAMANTPVVTSTTSTSTTTTTSTSTTTTVHVAANDEGGGGGCFVNTASQ